MPTDGCSQKPESANRDGTNTYVVHFAREQTFVIRPTFLATVRLARFKTFRRRVSLASLMKILVE